MSGFAQLNRQVEESYLENQLNETGSMTGWASVWAVPMMNAAIELS